MTRTGFALGPMFSANSYILSRLGDSADNLISMCLSSAANPPLLVVFVLENILRLVFISWSPAHTQRQCSWRSQLKTEAV